MSKRTSSAALALVPEASTMVTGQQLRAARALLKWSGQRLAKESGVSYPALQRAEAIDGVPNMMAKNLLALQNALESAGVIFLDPGENRDGGSGVRLQHQT